MVIRKVKNNVEKKITYRELNKKLKESYFCNNYESVIVLSYAMIEDRLLSLLHYLYVVNRNDKNLVPNDFVDKILRPLLKYNLNADKNKVYKIYNISTKIKIVNKLLKNTNLDNYYLYDCTKILNQYKEELNDFIKRLNSWLTIRNEIIHSSFNKNIGDLNIKLKEAAKEGYALSNLIKKYVNLIKDSHTTLSVRTKWEAIEKVVIKTCGYDKLTEDNLLKVKNDGILELENYKFKCLFNVYSDFIFYYIEAASGINLEQRWMFYYFLGDKFLNLNIVYNMYINIISSFLTSLKNGRSPKSIIYYNNKLEDNLELLKRILELSKNLNPSNQAKIKIIKDSTRWCFMYINLSTIEEHYQLYKLFLDRLPGDIFTLNNNKYDVNMVIKTLNNDWCEILNPILLEYYYIDVVKECLKQRKKLCRGYVIPMIFYFLLNLVKSQKLSKDVLIEIVKINGLFIKHFSYINRDDENIVLEAINQNYNCFEFASERIKNNKNFVLMIIEKIPNILAYISDELKDDEDIVSLAIKKNESLLKYASERLKYKFIAATYEI